MSNTQPLELPAKKGPAPTPCRGWSWQNVKTSTYSIRVGPTMTDARFLNQ